MSNQTLRIDVLPFGTYSVEYFWTQSDKRAPDADADVSASYVEALAKGEPDGLYAIALHNGSGRRFRIQPGRVFEVFPPQPTRFATPSAPPKQMAWVCDAKSGEGLRVANEHDLKRGLEAEAAGLDIWLDYDGRRIHLGLSDA